MLVWFKNEFGEQRIFCELQLHPYILMIVLKIKGCSWHWAERWEKALTILENGRTNDFFKSKCTGAGRFGITQTLYLKKCRCLISQNMWVSSKILTHFLKFYSASSVLEGEESAKIDFRDRNDTEFEELSTLVSIVLNKSLSFLVLSCGLDFEKSLDQ